MSAIEIRLLGGFQVQRKGGSHRRFESQKVRALLAYLACHRDRAQPREHLAALLWPEDDAAAARRNLRQAIYNLRYALGVREDGEAPVVITAHQTLQFNIEVDYWLDVEALDDALQRGMKADKTERIRELSRAAQLYRGDFLIGLHVKGGNEFEDWVLAEQERLRESVIQGLRALVTELGECGDYRQATRFARQLVEMDPLSEESHRELMHLYAQTSRRGRALAQYEDLCDLLERELGVEPLEETRDLYRSILEQSLPEKDSTEATEPFGPYVPMVGRSIASGKLRESYERCIGHGARLLVVEGEAGLGKTRLAKTLLHELTSKRRATVLQGRCSASAPPTSFHPFTEVVHATAWEDLSEDVQEAATRLGRLLPAPTAVEPPAVGPRIERRCDRIFASVADLLTILTHPTGRSGPRRPVIVFLDDLQWVGATTVDLLRSLLEGLADLPIWFLTTWEERLGGPDHPLRALCRWAGDAGVLDSVPLRRLEADEISEIATSLVSDADRDELATLLSTHGDGLPLRIVELINLLCDERALEATDSRRWSIVGDRGLADVAVPDTLDALIRRRIHRLPTSARQLLELAAVIGQTFDVGSLQRAAAEHMGVVEIGIELMLERWLIRQYANAWAADPRDRDLVLWARGARRGAFEFANYRIREAVYRDLNPLRRQTMHRQVAAAQGASSVETTAQHWERAGSWEQAFPLLARAAERAAGLGDRETGLYYCRQARSVLERLLAADDSEESGWAAHGEELQVLEERLELALASG